MKTINDLTVSVTYTINISEIEVTDDMQKALERIFDDNNRQIGLDANTVKDKELLAAYEWLNENIKESEAEDKSFEICGMETEVEE